MKRLALIFWFLALFTLARDGHAQATNLIDPLDPVYRDVQRLVAARLVDRVIMGQQPYSRLQLADIVRQAQRRLDSLAADNDRHTVRLNPQRRVFLQSLVEAMRSRFGIEFGPDSSRLYIRPVVQPLRELAVDVTRAQSPSRPIPNDNGLGSISGSLNPLLSNREGRRLVDGSNFVLSSEHVIESEHVALAARPELTVLHAMNGGDAVLGALQQVQLRVLLGNVAFDAGRESVRWGQGNDVGLLGSNNSPPLDLVRLSNEQLLNLPWIFSHLGPSRFTLFYSKLGSDQNFPNPYFVGYKLSFEPSRMFELGGVVYSKSGGHGAPRATFSARILDLLPFLDASDYANKFGARGKFEFSDRYAGIDGRLRIPDLGGAEFFAELLLNDFDVRRLASVLWQDAGHVFGLALPRLSADGRLGGSVEYHHTGDRYYEHTQFTTGEIARGTLIGDQLGPNSQGAYGRLEWYRTPWSRILADVALERRSNDQFEYLFVAPPNFGWERIESRPKEWRGRVMLSWQLLPERRHAGGLVQAGYERTHNFDFIHANDRNGFLARVALQYRFE